MNNRLTNLIRYVCALAQENNGRLLILIKISKKTVGRHKEMSLTAGKLAEQNKKYLYRQDFLFAKNELKW